MKAVYLILLILLSCGWNNKPNNDINLSQKLLSCLNTEFDSLDTELDSFENLLYFYGYLKDKSGESYHNLFKDISNGKKLELDEDFESNFFCLEGFIKYKNCLDIIKLDSIYINHANKFKELEDSFKFNLKNGNATIKKIALMYTKVLEPNDFKVPLHRIRALHSFFVLCQNSTGLNNLIPKPSRIKVHIDSLNNFHINDSIIAKSNLKDHILKLKTHIDSTQTEACYIEISADRSVKMGIISDFKRILGENKILKMVYISNKSRKK